MASNTTPVFTQANYDNLIAAISEGVKQVQYSDKMITYRSLDEMLRLKNEMERDLCIGPFATTGYSGRTVGSYCSGK